MINTCLSKKQLVQNIQSYFEILWNDCLYFKTQYLSEEDLEKSSIYFDNWLMAKSKIKLLASVMDSYVCMSDIEIEF